MNKYTFYKLSDIIGHMYDYSINVHYIKLYCDIIMQVFAFFNIGLIFVADLIKAIQKNKS